jgi:DNA-binding MarR family transcriptional regulator
MGIVANVQHANHLIGRHLGAALADLGIGQAEAHVLSVLAAGPAPVAGLAAAVGVKRSTLTNVLDRLEARGLAQREINPADRRSFVVRPTPAGRRAAREVAAAFAEVDEKLARATTASERKAFDTVLARLEQLL